MNLVKVSLLICNDPSHVHNSPIQRMIAFEENDHYVEVTQDGDTFDVLIDGVNARFNMSSQDALNYVMEVVA